jgi:hypothetical protein
VALNRPRIVPVPNRQGIELQRGHIVAQMREPPAIVNGPLPPRDRRLVIASEAKQSNAAATPPWIASSLRSSQ